MALVGYARVSSVGQRLDVQVEKLQHCDKLFQEHTSGSAAHTPPLGDCLEYVREGDMLVVTRLDRLARSTWHLCQIAEVLARKQVHLRRARPEYRYQRCDWPAAVSHARSHCAV